MLSHSVFLLFNIWSQHVKTLKPNYSICGIGSGAEWDPFREVDYVAVKGSFEERNNAGWKQFGLIKGF